MSESDDIAGLQLGERYTLTRRLAIGGMAEIYLAQQHGLAGFEKDVVIKCLQRRYVDDPRVVDMFLDEARIGALLAHPNVVHVYDVGEHEGQIFIVMEFIEGDELSNVCQRGLAVGRFLPLEHACDLMRQAAEALGYTHAKRDINGQGLQIVHRDISPSNLLVTDGGTCKLIDFGIASSALMQRDERGLVPGKFHYMSPEQVQGEAIDHRSDIFSLGIVLYEITVGRRLFKGAPELVMQRIVRDPIKPPTFINRSYPPQLEQIVMRALERNPADRYETAYELAQDLGDFLREAKLPTGHMRVALYLDSIKRLEGGEVRPELAALADDWGDEEPGSEAEVDDELHFNEMLIHDAMGGKGGKGSGGGGGAGQGGAASGGGSGAGAAGGKAPRRASEASAAPESVQMPQMPQMPRAIPAMPPVPTALPSSSANALPPMVASPSRGTSPPVRATNTGSFRTIRTETSPGSELVMRVPDDQVEPAGPDQEAVLRDAAMSALRAPLMAPVPGSLPLVSLPSAEPAPTPAAALAPALAPVQAPAPAPRAPSRTRGAIVVALAVALAGLAFLLAKTL